MPHYNEAYELLFIKRRWNQLNEQDLQIIANEFQRSIWKYEKNKFKKIKIECIWISESNVSKKSNQMFQKN